MDQSRSGAVVSLDMANTKITIILDYCFYS